MKRNILLIICDQLSALALGCMGNKEKSTHNIDKLSSEGITFTNAYTACPLCQPARASLWTSKYPHEIGVLTNLEDQGFKDIPETISTLGDVFSNNGYRCVHFGKKHDYGTLRGFEVIDSTQQKVKQEHKAYQYCYETFLDIDTVEKTIDFIKSNKDKPFLLVSDLQNPHNICGWIGENEGVHDDIPISDPLPELPLNFDIEDIDKLPIPIRYLCCTHRRLSQTAGWTDENYRHYLAAYHYYIRKVDKQIGDILKALSESGLDENTDIVFLADHGEGMAAHRMVTKQTSFYEETTRVPFIIKSGRYNEGIKISEPVSLIDVVPTLCDIADIKGDYNFSGKSLFPLINSGELSRKFIASEWHGEYLGDFTPGRMILADGYKYTHYLEGNGEELYDLNNDNGEMNNLAYDENYKSRLDYMRSLLKEHTAKTNDNYFDLDVFVWDGLRNHDVGYENHKGKSALDIWIDRGRPTKL